MNSLRIRRRNADGDASKVPFDWNNFVGSIGGWLSGTSEIIDSVKGNPDNYNVTYEQKKDSNTGLYIGIGAAVVVILVLVFAFRKPTPAA